MTSRSPPKVYRSNSSNSSSPKMTRSNSLDRKTKGDKDGQVAQQTPSYGIKYLPDGTVEQRTLDFTYIGDFVNGKFNGKGNIKYNKSGASYEGDFVNGMRTGKGKLRFKNSNTYEGDFVDNKYNGKGKFISEEYTYEGDFVDGKYNGKGIITPRVAGVDAYDGDFVDGEYNGYGELKNSEGTYKGYFENDQYIGQNMGQSQLIKGLSVFFPKPDFTIEQLEAEYDDTFRSQKIIPYVIRSNDGNICVIIKFLSDHIYIKYLGRCQLKGGKTLNIIEQIATQLNNINYISLEDVSNLDYHGSSINLYIYKILTKGQSWYNSLGYYSDNYAEEIKDNAKFKEMTIQFFQKEIELTDKIDIAAYYNHLSEFSDIFSIESEEIMNMIMSMTVPDFYEKIMEIIRGDESDENKAKWLSDDLDFVLNSEIINYNRAELKKYIQRNGGFLKKQSKKRNTYKKISKRKKKRKSYSRKRTNKSVKYK